MQSFSQIPEYSQYLLYIFLSSPNSTSNTAPEPVTVRATAGLLLKNQIRTNLPTFSTTSLDYLKSHIPAGLKDGETIVRNTAGSIISTLCAETGVLNWPSLIPDLLESLASSPPVLQEVSPNILYFNYVGFIFSVCLCVLDYGE